MKTKTILCLMMTVFFISCSVEKRHYLPGYHIEWKHQGGSPGYEQADEQKQPVKSPVYMYSDNVVIENIQAPVEQPAEDMQWQDPPVINNEMTKAESGIQKSESDIEKQNVNNPVYNNSTKAVTASDDEKEGGNAALRATGWVIWAIGLLVMLVLDIFIGLFICLIGVLFIWLGRKKKKEKPAEDEKKYEDVVYLKNGSVVRGVIIEQQPNVQLKIQTRDGNIFVYRMDEIEKIAKEMQK